MCRISFLFCLLPFIAELPAQEKPAKPAEPEPTYANVAYNEYEATVLDFWQAEGEGPRPLHVHIHGGGWINGDKSKVSGIQQYLDKGISVASINYRHTPVAPLPAPVHDAARAIQFLRSKSAEWSIRKDRVALSGGSAGACTSLWLACHDDLANPNSEDLVERESTRVNGIAVGGGQTSIDPKQIVPWLGPNGVAHQMICRAVGEKTIEDAMANYDKHEALYKEFSAINHVSKDDPPIFMSYSADMTLPSKNAGHGIHHPVFGVKMKEAADAVGMEAHLFIPGTSESETYPNAFAFLTSVLGEE